MTLPLVTALAIMTFAAAFHFYWAFGGRVGFTVSLPQRSDGQPVLSRLIGLWRAGALAVAIGLVVVAVLALGLSGALALPVPSKPVRMLIAVLGAACILRVVIPSPYVGFFKSIRDTRWARYDTRYYSPLFLILGISLLFIALG